MKEHVWYNSYRNILFIFDKNTHELQLMAVLFDRYWTYLGVL